MVFALVKLNGSWLCACHYNSRRSSQRTIERCATWRIKYWTQKFFAARLISDCIFRLLLMLITALANSFSTISQACSTEGLVWNRFLLQPGSSARQWKRKKEKQLIALVALESQVHDNWTCLIVWLFLLKSNIMHPCYRSITRKQPEKHAGSHRTTNA
jgi:hypothetical protein